MTSINPGERSPKPTIRIAMEYPGTATVVGTVAGTAAANIRIAPPAPSAEPPAPSGGATVSATTGEITLRSRDDNNKNVLIYPGVRVHVELQSAPGHWTSPESSNSSVLQRLSVSQPSGAPIATFIGVQAGQAVITAVAASVWVPGSGPRPRAPQIGFRVTVTVQSG